MHWSRPLTLVWSNWTSWNGPVTAAAPPSCSLQVVLPAQEITRRHTCLSLWRQACWPQSEHGSWSSSVTWSKPLQTAILGLILPVSITPVTLQGALSGTWRKPHPSGIPGSMYAIKKYRVAEWIKKQDTMICYLWDPFNFKNTYRLKMKGLNW